MAKRFRLLSNSWFRFGVRSLLAFTLAAGTGAAWFAAKVRTAQDRIAALKTLGPKVHVDRSLATATTEDLAIARFLGGELPPHGIKSVIMTRETDAQIAALTAFPELESLCVSEFRPTAENIDAVAQLERLRKLEVSVSDAPGDDWARLAEFRQLKNLQSFHLLGARLTSEAVAAIGQLPDLRSLSVSGRISIGPDDLLQLASLLKLESLDLAHEGERTCMVRSFPILRNLKKLAFHRVDVEEPAAAAIAELRTLEELALPDCALGDESVLRLVRLRELKALDLSGATVPNAAFEYVGRMTELEELVLGDAKFDNAGLARIGARTNLKSLKRLDLARGPLNDRGLETILRLKTLRHLDLSETLITDAGIGKLKQLGDVRRIWTYKTNVSEQALRDLVASLPALGVNDDSTPRRYAPVDTPTGGANRTVKGQRWKQRE